MFKATKSIFNNVRSTVHTTALPPSKVPIFTTISVFREWRQTAERAGQSVGFVPTMGALHAGHMSLVRRSLHENDHTVISIFLNPAQFGPNEDLEAYPQTIPSDIKLIESEVVEAGDPLVQRSPSAIFIPNVTEMYPSGITLDVSSQVGAFVEVKGLSEVLEGGTRPGFFRGVTTIVTKLFHVVEPTNAYFGQKDIQQAIILRRLCKDLLFSRPAPEAVHIVPTARDPTDGLALSSRNVYLNAKERGFAGTLRAALLAAASKWVSGSTVEESLRSGIQIVDEQQARIKKEGLEVALKLDYIELSDAETLKALDRLATSSSDSVGDTVILSGAVWVGKTRLIDNIILGDSSTLV